MEMHCVDDYSQHKDLILMIQKIIKGPKENAEIQGIQIYNTLPYNDNYELGFTSTHIDDYPML